jgi:hypothetical protein
VQQAYPLGDFSFKVTASQLLIQHNHQAAFKSGRVFRNWDVTKCADRSDLRGGHVGVTEDVCGLGKALLLHPSRLLHALTKSREFFREITSSPKSDGPVSERLRKTSCSDGTDRGLFRRSLDLLNVGSPNWTKIADTIHRFSIQLHVNMAS